MKILKKKTLKKSLEFPSLPPQSKSKINKKNWKKIVIQSFEDEKIKIDKFYKNKKQQNSSTVAFARKAGFRMKPHWFYCTILCEGVTWP